MVTNTERLTYTVEEAAKLLGIGLKHAYEMHKRGKIPGAFTLGGKKLVSKHQLDQFLAYPPVLSEETSK